MMDDELHRAPPSLIASFEAQVDRDPERVAATCAGRHLTYGALDAQANRLAAHLRELGAGPDVLVAVALARGLDVVVAVLAVLKSGAAYVPLDDAHPTERLRFVVEDARAALLVTRGGLFAETPRGVRRVDLDDDARAIAACSDARAPDATAPSDLAYVIYTSGSTGRPKGVAVTRANVARLFSVTQPLFGFGADDVWSLCHSVAFDFSVWELFGALLHGGRVVIVSREVAREPRALATLLVAEGVTRLSQTPSAFRQLMPALLSLASPPPLRGVVFGGESLDPTSLRPWVERFGDALPELVNMYGITETTVHVTHRRITARDVDGARGSVIGRALPDLAIELLDACGRPVAVGEVGEIYVAGEGVARGYLHRPALDAERFVPSPCSGRRAYRSGDLARALPDGDLVYVGRADQQVKIRGHRVETGEVCRALAELRDVADAAVVCRGHGDDRALVAYAVPQGDARLAPTSLRARLAQTLAPYMVPSAVVVIERLPLTVNGKLDEAALPAPSRARPAYRHAATPIESALCRCVARVLEVEFVGLDDRFVDLGGHSLRAAEVAYALEAECGATISVGALLSNQPIEELAARMDGAHGATPREAEESDGEASAAQRGIWLHAQRYPGDVAYHETLTLVIPHAVDARALERCLAEVVARHTALRTGFVWRAGVLARRVAPAVVVPITVHDLRALSPAEGGVEAQRLACEQARAPFDLTVPPLLRAGLTRLGADEHRLDVTVHHLVCDAPSLHLLATELAARYAASAQATPPMGHDEARCETSAATVGVRSSGLARAAARQRVRVPPALVATLRAVAADEGATLFMVLLAAWHALLHRYGDDDVRVATVVSRRPHTADAQRVGALFALAPITARPRGDLSFTELLASVRAAVVRALDAGAPALEHDITFESGFGMLPPPPRLAGRWQARLLDVASGAAKHELFALLQEQPDGGVEGVLEHLTARHDEAAVARMAGHYVALLAGIAAAPDCVLSELPMLSDAERAQLLAWAHGPADARETSSASVQARVLAQAHRTPDALAVEWEGGALTYAALARRAESIAACLIARGVGAERLVAVCFERSPDLVAALLGVLLAGGAFLALDASLPVDRIAQLVADARPVLALTTEALRGRVESAESVVCLDAAPWSEPPQPGALRVDAEPGHLAYVIYTSGSTGQPKGVQIEHGSLSNLATVCEEALGLGPDSRVLQFARVSFDVVVIEVLCTLAAGGAVVLPSAQGPLVGDELFAVLRERAITLALLSPSLLATLPEGELPALSTLVSGGEICTPEVVDRWAKGRRFLNAYGPTEATVGATFARCEPGDGRAPIGRPARGVEVYVLDADRALVPVGVAGELYLGGAGLARGYLGAPALTAACFVEHPFRPGARLYRTGDRVRWRDDGQLDFIGRFDRQLKLRGHRIEPAEVESALRAHPAVRDAYVTARELTPGSRALCAYVVVRDGACDEAALRSFLRARLPESMVPTAVVRLDAIPLTAHGKVDASALPLPRTARADAPRPADVDTLEARIASVWAAVLGVAQVGHGESFFDLGGTSLLLVEAQRRLEAALGVTIPTPLLFEHPTPGALASRLRLGETDLTVAAADRAQRLRRTQATRPTRRARP